MADVNLRVNLGIDADTSQAKSEIASLNNTLKSLATNTTSMNPTIDDKAMSQAAKAAQELQTHLRAAINVDTGKLDLGRFATSMKSAGQNLEYFKNSFMSAGTQGEQAFMGLSRQLVNSEASVVRLNGKMAQFMQTMKNTIQWQAASMIIHGMLSTLQGAYKYAQDLNKSLNDIRIVTGQSTEQMAEFAQQANKAAKSLSTTTTDYTNASLIYFQQGLDTEEVEKRTEITVKMANASGQSAQVVSDQLTAVWNNFAKGSDDLEHYADVMVRLGADTASSSDEIAQGLEKFAAVSDTVGLSYEHAAAALATVTATTRQSADVVGTAFKTIFARMEGLKLGETLDDGTTLNQYSEALAKAGVSIKDANGELKDMDTILDETMAKWGTLSRDQQIALAQQVAGVRQYQQFIALMDNADFFKENLARAQGADGSLQEQADIYAESWEASAKRVQDAWEDVYDSLFSDKTFIQLNNIIAGVTDTISGLVDAFGGLGGIIQMVGAIFLQHFARQMPAALQGLKQNLMIFIGQGQKVANQQRAEMNSQFDEITNNQNLSASIRSEAEGLKEVNNLKMELANNSQYMTNQQRTEIEGRIQLIQSIHDEITAMEEEAEVYRNTAAVRASSQQGVKDRGKANTDYQTYLRQAEDYGAIRFGLGINKDTRQWGSNSNKDGKIGKAEAGQIVTNAQDAVKNSSNAKELQAAAREYGAAMKTVVNSTKPVSETAKGTSKDLLELIDKFEQTGQEAKDTGGETTKLKEALDNLLKQIIQKAGDYANNINADANQDKEGYSSTRARLHNNGVDIKSEDAQEEVNQSIITGQGRAVAKGSAAVEGVKTRERIEQLNVPDKTQALTQFASALMSTEMAISAVRNAWAVFSNSDSTFLDKLGAIFGVVTTAIFVFTSATTAATTIQKLFQASVKKSAAATNEDAISHGVNTTSKIAETIATMGLTSATLLLLAAIVAIIAVIALLVIGFQNMKKNSPEEQIKRIDQNIQDLKESIEDTTSKIEDLSQSFSELRSAEDTIKGLEKGSLEWFEQLAKIQDIVNHLLELFPDLQKYLEYDENGMPYFKEGAEDAVAGRLFQQQQGDRLAVGLEEKRKNDKRINPETAFRGVDSGKNRPGDPGSFDISSIEEKLGKLFDNKKSDAKSQEEKDKYEQAKNEINTEDYIKDFFDSHIGWSPEAFTNALIEDLGLDSSDQNLVQTVQELLNNYTIGIEEYSKIFLEGTKAMAEATQQTAAALVASTDDINSAEYGDVLQDKAVQMISKTAEDTLDLLVGDDVNTRWKAKNEWESSHAAGLKDYKFKGFTDEGMQYTYTENGETKTATAEWSELAGAVAMSTENIGKFKDELVTMSGDLTTLDKVIDNTKTEEETKNSAKAVKNAIVEGNMDNLTYDELTNFATNNSTDKQKKQTTENLGLTGDYTEEIKQAIAVSSAAWDTLNGQARDFGIEIGNLTQKQAQIYIDITEDIMSAGSKISEQRSNMVDYNDPNLSLKEKEAAMDEENALRNAEAKLRDFSDSLRALSESPEFDTILENLNKLGISADDIINGNIKTIEDFGGSAEQYSEYLENMTNAAEKFADATHQIDSDGILTEDEAKELGVTTEAFENYVDQVYEAEQANKDLSKEQKRSKKAIAEQYEETLEAAKALEDLSDVFKKYDKELSNGSGIEDYGAAVAEMKEPLSELLKIDASKLSNDFFDPTNIQLMRDALNGSAEAIDQLRLNAAEDIYMQIHPELSPEEVTAQIGSLQEYLNGLDTKFDVNGELHDEGVIAGLQSMLANMNLTVGEAKEIMAGLGYSMEVESDQSEVTDTQETPDSYEPVIEDVPVTMGTVTGAPPDQQASTIEYTVPKVTYRPISGEETTSTKTTTGMATTVTANDGELLSSGHVKIKSLKKTPVSGNAVQAARPTVGNNSSSSPKGKNPSGGNSGGGGGSDKKKKPFVKETIEKAEKRMKKLDEEKEKYFEINKQLEDQSTLLDRLNKKKDTMWGIGRIKAIQQENEAIKKNIELNKQKLSEAKWYAEDYKKQLINIGAMFDENGNIVNYDELVENNVNAYNNGQKEIEKWENYIKNTLGEKLYNLQQEEGTEEEQWALEAEIKKQEELLDNFKERRENEYTENMELIGNYYDARSTAIETENSILDDQIKIQEQNLELLEAEVEIQDQLNDSQKKFFDFIVSRYEDSLVFANKYTDILLQSTSVIDDQMATTDRMFLTLQEDFYSGAINASQYAEKLADHFDRVLGSAESYQDTVEGILDKQEEYFDNAIDEIDRLLGKYDEFADTLEHVKTLNTAIYGEKAYGKLNTIDSIGLTANRNKVEDLIKYRSQLLKYQKDLEVEMNKEFAAMNDPTNTAAPEAEKRYNALKDLLYETEDTVADWESQMAEALEEELETFQEIYQRNLMQMMDNFEKAVADGPLDDMIAKIERMNASQEEFLTTTNKIYETNKLMRQAQEEADKTQNKAAKQQYNAFIQQMQQRQEQSKLSEFELSIAQAEFEILQKRIALEEAQQAKNQVRLTRDANGNFGYVYTANQDDISKAEQELEDAQNNRYNLALEGIQKYQDQYWQHLADWRDEIQEIEEKLQADPQNKDKYMAQIAEINKHYLQLMQNDEKLYYYASDVMKEESATKNLDYTVEGIGNINEVKSAMEELRSEEEIHFDDYMTNMTEIQEKSRKVFAENAPNDIQGLMEKLGELQTKFENSKNVIEDTLIPSIGDLGDAWDTIIDKLKLVVEWTEEALRLNMKQQYIASAQGEGGYAARIEQRLQQNPNLAFESDEMQTYLWARWAKLGYQDDENYEAELEAYLNEDENHSKNDAYYKALNYRRMYKILMTDWQELLNQNPDATWIEEVRQEKMTMFKDIAAGIINYLKTAASSADDEFVKRMFALRGAKMEEMGLVGGSNGIMSQEDLWKEITKRHPKTWNPFPGLVEGYATGGYTGSWGPSGKIGILHQKELVLNQDDTKNLLQSVSIVRDISDILDRSVKNMTLSTGTDLKAALVGALSDQVLQQQVTIEAQFPNVTDHNEIERAIDDLINSASQFAYR